MNLLMSFICTSNSIIVAGVRCPIPGATNQLDTVLAHLVKGTVPPDISPLVFFFKQLLLVPVNKLRNDFDFFRIFVEIFDFSGASPVSLTPAKQTILL